MIIGIDASRANRVHKTGTEWYSYYIIRWLAKIDKKNEYILYTDKPLKGGLLDLTTKVHYEHHPSETEESVYDKKGYQILRSPNNNFKAKVLDWPFKRFWTLGRLTLEMLIHKPDVLFVPAHTLPLVAPKKTITTIHDVAFARDCAIYRQEVGDPKEESAGKILNFFIKLITFGKYKACAIDYFNWSTRQALKRAKRVITVSNFTKNEIVDVYGDYKDKIKVIYNGYSVSWYKPDVDKKVVDEVLDKYGIEKPYFFYIGRLEKKKNIPKLVEAFAEAKEKRNFKHKLVLIGDASFGFDDVKYNIDAYNVESEIIMPGWIKEEDIPFIYSGADAFIFPTRHEGFGIPVVQAMACGVPVLASDLPVLREVGGDAIFYFDADNVNSIASAIIEIMDNEKLKNDLIVKGYKQAKKYSWEKASREVLGEIESL